MAFRGGAEPEAEGTSWRELSHRVRCKADNFSPVELQEKQGRGGKEERGDARSWVGEGGEDGVREGPQALAPPPQLSHQACSFSQLTHLVFPEGFFPAKSLKWLRFVHRVEMLSQEVLGLPRRYCPRSRWRQESTGGSRFQAAQERCPLGFYGNTRSREAGPGILAVVRRGPRTQSVSEV